MATKTITPELDAYEKLRRAKRRPNESFSSVIRRARFHDGPRTAGELLERLLVEMETGNRAVPTVVLDALDRAQEEPRVSDCEWS